jgi:autotransporter-associated beta strand protein
LTISGPISESTVGSSLTKTGVGALVLAGSNIYSGGTEVDAGILVAANGGNGSATGSGNVVLNGGTLASGTDGGRIAGAVQAGSGPSTIAPGGVGTVGTLTIGNLVTSSSLTLNFDLTTPGGNSDLLIIAYCLTLVPHTALTFNTNPADGDYRLIGGNFGTPTLSDFDLPTPPPGEGYSLSTAVDPGYIDLVVVPEPGALALLAVGVIGLLGWTWRRGRKAA